MKLAYLTQCYDNAASRLLTLADSSLTWRKINGTVFTRTSEAVGFPIESHVKRDVYLGFSDTKE